jgi:exopolysaccharide biosynthesis protein
MLLLTLFFLIVATAYAQEFYDAPAVTSSPGISTKELDLHTDRQKNIKSFLTIVENPMGFMHVETATPEGCTKRQRTSKTAAENKCFFAINAGPFNMDNGQCEGSIISEGRIIQMDDTSGFSSFGISSSENKYVFGNINSTTVANHKIDELVSGFIGPLLIKDNAPVTSGSTLIAQRQAIGLDASGKFLILTIDGAENRDSGMTINELGEAFHALGAVVALNLDGGGSTTTYEDGHWVDRPTCSDYRLPACERKVASILCVKETPN